MKTSLFGRVRLGYVLVESEKLDQWERFGAEGLGMQAERLGEHALGFRIDAHLRRLIVTRGPAEDVQALGWQVDDEAALAEIERRLALCGIALHTGSEADAILRGVLRFVRFTGPKGQPIELFVHARTPPSAPRVRGGGFVTGASGMGHVAITTREPEAALAFWQDIFDARVSDYIEDKLDGVQMDFTFLHLNERHHSVAIASTRKPRMDPIRTRIHHLNLQAAEFDDVADALLRCRQLGFEIANSIGQHPNDRELSFYVVTPSGFEMELGWRPCLVPQDQPWTTTVYQGISRWGHFPENLTRANKLRRVGRALLSMTRTEQTLNTRAIHEHP
ncbi:VOC family protein [Duganella sp. FT3S]|uniref:VOC family protein n=1 Tax=Rugamonas fusca TaxID=2758568 RepID=A0A7W2EHL0_9BURK|nr:VOC family protein [Rugamonas fusca]MBA5606056.1 VOC family protein [Rugamonas fusca]